MRQQPTRTAKPRRRTSWRWRAFVILLGLIVLAGISQIGMGLYIKAKARLAQHLLERAWSGALDSGGGVRRPWPWADTWPVARISVPRLEQSTIVLAGANGQAMAFAPGHVRGTPLPGQPGTAVFAAHRDTHFAFLAALVPGDEIRVETAQGGLKVYEMTHGRVVRWDRSGIDPDAPGHAIALVTCWPFDARHPGPLRYVATARLKSPALLTSAASAR